MENQAWLTQLSTLFCASGALKYIGLLLMWKFYHGLHSQLHNISVARLLLFTDKILSGMSLVYVF